MVWILICLASFVSIQDDADQPRGKLLLVEQAQALRPLMPSPLAQSFLQGVNDLPEVTPREILINSDDPRQAIAVSQLDDFPVDKRDRFERRQLDEQFYYFTRYGSPLAFGRAIEVLAPHTTDGWHNRRVVDFGFGSIGHLRIMASRGADVTGIEVDSVLQALYSESMDTELSFEGSENSSNGRLRLLFGKFPSELASHVGNQIDLFVSKNTLKRGYIHPQRPVDPRRMVQLDATDDQFLAAVHQCLGPKGLFLIYNLHPPQATADKPFIPWADGRSPFDRNAFQKNGFTVIEFDKDDSVAARQFGKALGWADQMDLQKQLFATYTLVRKTNNRPHEPDRSNRAKCPD